MRVVWLFVYLMALNNSCFSQSPVLTKYFEWYKEHYSINSLAFSPLGKEIALVINRSVPDGHDAELAEEKSEDQKSAVDKDPRYADPNIIVVNLNTSSETKIDFGWTPSFSPDGNKIAYSHQTIPISGKRVLAESLAGNSIKLYDRSNKEFETLAIPLTDSYSTPVFTDSATIIYKKEAAVNGAYSGGIGFNSYNLITKKSDSFYSGMGKFDRPQLTGNLYLLNNNIFYTVYIPQDSGDWLSGNYEHILFGKTGVVHNFGKKEFKSLEGKIGIDSSNEIVFLDDDHRLMKDKNLLIRYAGKNLAKREIKFKYSSASLSPDGKYMFYYDYGEFYAIMDTRTFNKQRVPIALTEVYSLNWSGDSKNLAIIQGHNALADTDVVTLFRVE